MQCKHRVTTLTTPMFAILTRMGTLPIASGKIGLPQVRSKRASSSVLLQLSAEDRPYTKKLVLLTDALLRQSTEKWEQMNGKLFMTLLCMSFLWIGSQIPLFLFGSVLPLIYNDIGGVDRWVWFIIGYLIPNAALCPFVGALSDLFGRQKVAIVGQICLIVGPIITATASSMNIAIGKLLRNGVIVQLLTLRSW